MIINRNYGLNPVRDFMLNVQPHLRLNELAEEVYKDKELIGWKIVRIA
jgi:hypothetical protein